MSSSERLITRVSHAQWGDNAYCGYHTVTDLVGHDGFWSLLALGVGHARLTPSETQMLDDLAVCIIAADPRIWPLKVVRLASAFGGLVSGLCAGLLATDGSTIGPISLSHSARFVCSIASEVGSSISPPAVEAAVGRRLAAPDFRFPGFGVPFREQDERVGAVGTCVASRGRAEGYHWRLVSAMSAVLAERKKLPMNVAGAAGAVLLDLGFDADQIDPISLALFFPNHFANAVEGAEQAPVLLQRLPADAVRYDGPEPRPSPRARGDD